MESFPSQWVTKKIHSERIAELCGWLSFVLLISSYVLIEKAQNLAFPDLPPDLRALYCLIATALAVLIRVIIFARACRHHND